MPEAVSMTKLADYVAPVFKLSEGELA